MHHEVAQDVSQSDPTGRARELGSFSSTQKVEGYSFSTLPLE